MPSASPGAVAAPPAAAGVHAVRGRHDRERVEHPQLVGLRVEDDSVFGMQAPPPRENRVRVAELTGGRGSTVLDEERIGAAAEPEVGLVHGRDANG